jgi:DNA-binding transcriptional regulator YbjK
VERRRQLIAATVEVMTERGIEGVTHRSVAARAGMPLSNTSYFFESIDALIGAAVTDIADRIVARLDELAATFADSDMTVDDYAETLIALAASVERQQVIVQFEAYLAVDRRPELQEPVHRIMLAFEKAIADACAAGGIADPVGVARQLSAVVDGFALHKAAWPRDDTDEVMTAVLRQMVTHHLAEARR